MTASGAQLLLLRNSLNQNQSANSVQIVLFFFLRVPFFGSTFDVEINVCFPLQNQQHLPGCPTSFDDIIRLEPLQNIFHLSCWVTLGNCYSELAIIFRIDCIPFSFEEGRTLIRLHPKIWIFQKKKKKKITNNSNSKHAPQQATFSKTKQNLYINNCKKKRTI